jgi:Amiloride-sensitive sodium channel
MVLVLISDKICSDITTRSGTVFADTDLYKLFKMKQSFTLVDFLSNFGGFMGLLAGISVLSIVEIFDHALRQLQRNNRKVHPAVETRRIRKEHALYHIFKYFVEFTKTSDLHGLPYITDQREGRWGRIFWAFVVLLSFVVCTVLIRDINQQAEKSPVATMIDARMWTLDDVSDNVLELTS